jgi:hypothetical protein
MAHNVVNSNPRIKIKPLIHRQKPPDIPSNHTLNPSPHSPSPAPSTPALSYTSGRQRRPSSPSPTLGRKRSHEGPPDDGRACPGNPHTPVKLTPYTSPSFNISTQIDPLQFEDSSDHDDDQDMENPGAEDAAVINNPENNGSGSEEDHLSDKHFDAVNKIHHFLGEIHRELLAAQYEEYLNLITENPNIKNALLKCSSFFSPDAQFHQLNPIFTGIADLHKMVEQVTIKLDKMQNAQEHNPLDKSINGSIHAATTKDAPPPKTNASGTPKPLNIPARQPSLTTPKPTIPLNPNSSHHPSRLVAQFLPNGLPPDRRPDPCTMVPQINSILASKQSSKHLKVVAASFNNHGNLIISTRSDQTAEELLRHKDSITAALTTMCGSQEIALREDKKWYKIQIDGVNTGSLTVGGGRMVHPPEDIHTELSACNPTYASAQDAIVAKPRWLRTEEELLTTLRSSLVFAISDEATAKLILSHRSLAAFGKHCSVRAFQDRPPVTQCRKCWSLEHPTHKCSETNRCRLCSDTHQEEEHDKSNPRNCPKCTSSTEAGDSMATDDPDFCPHDIRCINCLGNPNVEHDHPADARRCPARLLKYGTAREDERRAAHSNNPWIKVKTKKPKPRATTDRNPQNPSHTTPNRYGLLNPLPSSTPTPTAPNPRSSS